MSVLILLVDDEPDMEALVRQYFRQDIRAGRFAMEFAVTALDALGTIEAARGRDLILLLSDINMPGMSGFDLLRRAKAIRPDLPVVMISAYGDAQTRGRAIEAGADNLLPKPLDFDALRVEVDRCLAAWHPAP